MPFFGKSDAGELMASGAGLVPMPKGASKTVDQAVGNEPADGSGVRFAIKSVFVNI